MIETSVDGGIARIGMASPPVNALSPAFLAAFEKAMDELERRNDWSVLHLYSRQDVFCAGGDLQSMARWMASASPATAMKAYVKDVQRLFARIETLPQVSIAEIRGPAMGGGLELALACDLRIASKTAKLGLPELGIGLLPAGGGTQRLTRLCGRGVASRLIFGAEVITGAAALDLGLVQWAEAEEQLSTKTGLLAAKIASIPLKALLHAKSCLRTASSMDDRGYAEELEAVSYLLEQPETQARISGFLERNR